MTMLQASYCRNHDYNNDFNWAYKVKTNVYKCFVEARNEKSIGYMKPLKNLWDEIHSEYNLFRDKNPSDQASRVHKRNVVMDIKYSEITTSTSRNIIVFPQIMEIITGKLLLTKITYRKRLFLSKSQMIT